MGIINSALCGCPSDKDRRSRDEILADLPTELRAVHERLHELCEEKKYLESDRHFLKYYIVECRQAIDQGSVEEAQNALDNLIMELDVEEKQIAAAFVKFDSSGDDVLKGDEIKFMMDYLGFPCTPEDLQRVLCSLDKNGDEQVSFDEFLEYVGRMGGSTKLFEMRRRGGSGGGSAHGQELLRMQLLECGVQQEAQAYWHLIAEPELDAVVGLASCQQAAVRHIRALAQENHNRALPKLQARVQGLGYNDSDLWMALAWIRELSPVIIHLDVDKMMGFLRDDTHYRNQFETNSSGGLKNKSVRTRWERDLFGNAYADAKPFDRPKYGVQNIWNDYRGVVGCKQYGDSYIVLKNVRLRCTFSPEDSANMPATKLAVLDFYAHVLQEYSDKELAEALRVATGGICAKLGDSEGVIEKWGKYKEAQIHGEIHLDKNVERFVVHDRHKSKQEALEEVTSKHGWKLTWMSEMKDELKHKPKDMKRMFSETIEDWREQHGLKSQKAGRCKCGRPVGPAGGFCCVGCKLGFGHDVTCGKIDKMDKLKSDAATALKEKTTHASKVLQRAVAPLASLMN